MNADDLEQLAEEVKRGLRDTVLQHQQDWENRIAGMVQQATQDAADPTFT